MRKIIFIFLLFLICTVNVQAHILKTDGSIGAVLHIDPDDDPIARQSSYFFFEFKDKQNIFKLENCDCKITIFEQGKQRHRPSEE